MFVTVYNLMMNTGNLYTSAPMVTHPLLDLTLDLLTNTKINYYLTIIINIVNNLTPAAKGIQ